MVQPPYWVAARIYAATASNTGRARISGTYTLNTGQDLDDLEPKLYLDAVEAWLWDHFTTQEQADEWLTDLDRVPVLIFRHPTVPDFDIRACAARAAILTAMRLTAINAGGPDIVDDAPPGWSNAELLAQSMILGPIID